MKNLVLVSLLTASIIPARAQSTFTDVPRNHWAFEAVQKLADDGIVVGVPETSPDRAQQAAAKVQTSLNANTTLKQSGIWVAPISTNKLAVRGVVAGRAQVKWALHLAKLAAPDFEVVNQLGISTKTQNNLPLRGWDFESYKANTAFEDSSQEATITPNIKEALGDNKALEGSHIDIDTDVENRVVYLKGTVRDAAQKALAGAIARQEVSKRNLADKFTLRNELTISR